MTVPAPSPAAAGLFDLTGQTAVVTGASRGIGLAMAASLAEAGADVVGVSSSINASGNDVRDAVEAAGRTFTGIQADLADRAQVQHLAALLSSEHDVDILVNNAGGIAREPAVSHSDEDWDRILELNLSNQFVLTRDLGRGMLERRRGRVIFVASLLSFQGGLTVPGYTASKSAIAGLTKALCNEWARHGVNVNAIAPGYIETDNTAPLRADPARSQAIGERIPAGRWGVPDDLRGATVFLASRASDYVHGVVLPVDGGWLAR